MNMSFAKKLLGGLIVLAALVSFTTKADRANFSGSWALNEGKAISEKEVQGLPLKQ